MRRRRIGELISLVLLFKGLLMDCNESQGLVVERQDRLDFYAEWIDSLYGDIHSLRGLL